MRTWWGHVRYEMMMMKLCTVSLRITVQSLRLPDPASTCG